ncbi:MAG: TonB-dependent receptor [Muribaculaceae bacterium]|nr:TonB-dependent receptor [Muribaculaceae bacterium]
MPRPLIIILSALLSATITLNAGNITRTYHDMPMPDVLRDIDNTYTEGNINFIFNELEDYTVTTAIIDKPVLDALYEVIGFYPIRVNKDGNDLYIECFRKERNKVKGRLIDEHFNPVEYANVILFDPSDSSFITSGVSNSNGDFVIPVAHRHILLKTRCIGYMPFSGQYGTGNIGTIRLHTDAKILKEVRVERKTIAYDGDKITAWPTTIQVNHSQDLFSLLAQQPFPGLFVNEQFRDIKVYNRTPVILIDGIRRSVQDLIAIDPKNILRFEYSTTVPVKYLDGNSDTGILYIYLRQPKEGGTFYADYSGAFTTGFINADAGVSYNQGKSEFTLDYYTSWRDYEERKYDNIQSYIGYDFRTDLVESGINAPLDYNDHQINFGYNYRHDRTLFFSAKLYNSLSLRHSSSNGSIHDTYIGNYCQRSATRDHLYTPSVDMYLKKEWDGGNTIEVQVTGTLSQNDYRREIYYQFSNGDTASYPSQIDNRFRSLISEISYEKIFSEKTSLHIGYQNHFSHSENDYYTYKYTSVLDQSNNYLYFSLSQRIGKASLTLGSGIKFLSMKSETNRRDFTRNLSSVNIGIPLGKKFSMGITGKYTPVIPSLFQLTDLNQSSSNYLMTTGNPELKTEHKLQGTIRGYYFYNNVNLGLSTEYCHLINPMSRNVTYLGDGKFISRTENYNRYDRFELGGHIALTELFDKHLSVQLNGGYKYISTRSLMQDIYLNTFYAQLRLTAYLGKWTISSFYYLPNKYIDGNYIHKNENWSTLTVGFKPDRHWYISLSGCLLFHPEGTEYPRWNVSSTNPGYYYVSIPENGNMIMFTARYNISFGRIFGKTKRSLNNSDINNTAIKPE